MKDGGSIEDVTSSGIGMEQRRAPTRYPKLADGRLAPVVAPILADPKATFREYTSG